RPEATRGVHSIEDPILLAPADVLVDTSFVVEALIETQPLHEPCRDFLQRLLEVDAVLHFNRLLEMELVEAAFRLALKERFGRKKWEEARLDGRARIRAGRLMEQAKEAWEEVLDAFAFVRVELDEVNRAVPQFMQLYGLQSYDAVHAASALYS